jgi:2-polyprenyl-6-methoxyphenol hydroxylase-like FAD-dependent oxidoreductase
MQDVIIAGGGIGGLAIAVALQQRGIDAHVFEAAPVLEPAGAGILVPPNAFDALERLGLAGQIRDAGTALARVELHDLHAGALQVITMEELAVRHPTVAIRRAALHRRLAAALAPGTLHLGKVLDQYEADPTAVGACFACGATATARLLIGADGLRSAVRGQMRPSARLRFSGQICFRGLAPVALGPADAPVAVEIWGGAERFGFAATGDDTVYWYAPITAAAYAAADADGEDLKRRLRALYAAFPAPVPDLIAATPAAAILRTDLYDCAPFRGWSAGNVVLLGDAAHAATPNLGQGGAQALEDAIALAARIADSGFAAQRLSAALADFERARRRRTRSIAARSWHLGRAAHWQRPTLRRARNLLLRAVPAAVRRRQTEQLFTPVL